MLYVTSILIGDLVRYQLCKVSLVKAKHTASNYEFAATILVFGAEFFLHNFHNNVSIESLGCTIPPTTIIFLP